MGANDPRKEVTPLTPDEEAAFRQWVAASGITDVDAPQSRYDYRGYWKDLASQGAEQTKLYADGLHFTDTYKQHGHNTFSQESQYSTGMYDGGRWHGEDYYTPAQQIWEATHADWQDSPVVPVKRSAQLSLRQMTENALIEVFNARNKNR